ncbi:MAG: glycosyltransferase [Eubacteriaceae bacterium]|nr:glycosyltransferase [Eubacteriaceae bacterium]
MRTLKKILRYIRGKLNKALKPKAEKLTKEPRPAISVIIPTYKNINGLKAAIASVLSQTYPAELIEIVVAINGPNEAFYESALEACKVSSTVKAVYTPLQSASAARNLGISAAKGEWIAFLDDDDMFSRGYLSHLAKSVYRGSNIVCGKMAERTEGRSSYSWGNYINTTIKKLGKGPCYSYSDAASLFSSLAAKLYRACWLKGLLPMREDLPHTEDVVFWAENFQYIKGFAYIASPLARHAYIRSITEGSLSRPGKDSFFSFYITGRLSIVAVLTDLMFDVSIPLEAKLFIAAKINSQYSLLCEKLQELDGGQKADAIEQVFAAGSPFINKGRLSESTAIAFCHNFPPYADPSSYVACRRLAELDRITGKLHSWHAYSANMSNAREADLVFHRLFAQYAVSSVDVIGQKAYFNASSQYAWGRKAYHAAKDAKAEIIYSRSLWAGSHVAAWLYKQEHPDAKWYAEFSDPIAYSAQNKKRPNDGSSVEWEFFERIVYESADTVIFTNSSQRQYMLGYLGDEPLANKVMEKSIILSHPVIDSRYANLEPSSYALDRSAINIGFFGSFYESRSEADLIKLCANPKACVHIFTSSKVSKEALPANAALNSQLGYFEFLNVASKMDYLFLSDISFGGLKNPYLPSKLSDYLATQVPILAVVNEASPLSEFDSPQLIKVSSVSSELVQSLVKRL